MNEENNLFLNFFKENEEKGRFRAKRRRFRRKFRDKRNQRNLDKSNQRRQLWDFYQKSKLKTLTGIDLPDAAAESCNIFGVNKQHEAGDSRIVYGNMESYAFNKKFDVIIAGDVLEHVSNQGLFLDNINKHLKDDGYFIMTTPNAKWPTVFIKPNPTHVLWHDIYTLKVILARTGFEINRIEYYYGNKTHYNFFKKILAFRQSVLMVCTKLK